MKKALLAATALVASAGVASAQGISVSGFAEMGIFGGDGIETQLHTDIDVTFTGSGATDDGLAFGMSIDLDESDGAGARGNSLAFDNNTQGGETIFISGGFGTLTMGDTDGALDWALTEAIIGGSITDNHEHGGYNGNSALDGTYDGQIARYDYSFGDFSFAASVEIDDTTGAAHGDPVFGIGFKYKGNIGGGTLGFGIGYQSVDTGAGSVDYVGTSLSYSVSGFTGIVNYSDYDTAGQHVGVALGYETGAILVAVNYGLFSELPGAGTNETEGYGVVVNYDLGGGAVLQAGYGATDTTRTGVTTSTDSFSLGLALSF